MALQRRAGAGRPVHQLAAAIGAAIVERVGAFGAEGAFERTDERPRRGGGQVDAAAFAIGAHVEHGGGGSGGGRGWKDGRALRAVAGWTPARGRGDERDAHKVVTPDLFRGPPGGTFGLVTIERNPCVYMLASGYNGTLYVGVTSNLLARIVQHRDGTFGGFTAQFSVHRLVYFEFAATMEAAISREKQLKRYRREWKRNLIEAQNPAWNDLAVGFGLEPLKVMPGGTMDPGTRPG